MKKLLLAATTAAMMSGAGIASAVEIAGNVALTSDYKFRGLSQTDEGAAIQGGFDLGFDNGFYVGTWGSNVDFANSLELDYYGGWAGDLSDSVSVDVGYLYYDYPSSDTEDDYQEVYASVSFADFTVGAAYSDDYYLETGKFYYVYADYGFELGDGWGVSLHVGLNEFAESSSDNDASFTAFLTDDADSYVDYSVGVSKDYAGVTWDLSYVGTDLDEEEYGDTDYGDGAVIFTISKSL
jgi:uncharacterized protein (TIGR02001 family)